MFWHPIGISCIFLFIVVSVPEAVKEIVFIAVVIFPNSFVAHSKRMLVFIVLLKLLSSYCRESGE